MCRWQSGQLQWAVNPLGQPYVGSNPTLHKLFYSNFTMKLKQHFKDCIENIDFEKIEDVMRNLDWEWYMLE
jgi:hypothetical protein